MRARTRYAILSTLWNIGAVLSVRDVSRDVHSSLVELESTHSSQAYFSPSGSGNTIDLVDYPSQVVPIDSFFNNQAASWSGASANFDSQGSSFDAKFLPVGPWLYDGIKYGLPTAWGNQPDNVLVDGQVVSLPEPTYVHELHIVYAGDEERSEFAAKFTLDYSDNTTEQIQLVAKSWWRTEPSVTSGAISTPYHFEKHGSHKNWNSSQIFQWSTSVSSTSPLERITFPSSSGPRLHIFAISVTPSSVPSGQASGPVLSVRRARFTSRWEIADGNRLQAVEVTLANLLPSYTFSAKTSVTSRQEIEVSGANVQTILPGMIYRLVPADQVRVDVLVLNSATSGNATVQINDAQGNTALSRGWLITPLQQKWTPDENSLSAHETPTWWNQAKFGIFIHWGVYSVPAWAPSGVYAEWYDFSLHRTTDSSNPTWSHHMETFGKDVIYDDFIRNFTASKFNASAWVDLFDRAGAKYFVLTTKHHDGIALFDTGKTSNRNTVRLGPQRDFLSELFTAAKQEKPHLHRGTYFSVPEWHSPDYSPYGFKWWPGGLARNPFNSSELEPYTGRLDINDYLNDLQLPQMLTLAEQYDTEIMWCDIGGPNKTLEFAPRFYNHAMAQGRQVTMNDRCGVAADHDTPEYATFGSIQTRKWETSEGMDPSSYGLNSATHDDHYKNGSTIVQNLVDIVSKNGNYLLNVGPNAEGEIIPAMTRNLLDAGAWLKYSGDCVYATDYWFQGSEDINPPALHKPARFLLTPKAFCIVAFTKPLDGQLVINKRAPILPGDKIVLLSPAAHINGTHNLPFGFDSVVGLPWTVNESSGQLVVNVSESVATSVKYAWAFQVLYNIDN